MPKTTDHNALRRRRRIRRVVVAAVAVLVFGPIIAIAVFAARFDPNAYKPEIAAAVEKALGRRLALNGPISLGVSLAPTISAEDVALANPQGFSRPEMATLKRLDAKVALLPLLSGRLEIRRIALVQPVIAIEINRAGQSNLKFAPPAPVATPQPPSSPPHTHGRAVAIDVGAIRIENGRLSWQDDRTGHHGTLQLASFTATSANAGARTAITARAIYAGLTFTLKGETGPFAQFGSKGGLPPWPVQLVAALGAAKLSLNGSIADPGAIRGYHFRLQAMVPALEQLSPLFPAQNLPALHDLALSADISGSGTKWPQISDVAMSAGKSDLGAMRQGVALTGLSFTAPRLGQPCKLTLSGAVRNAPFSLTATLGPPAALLPASFGLPAAAAPWPVALQVQAAGANLSISGTVTRPASAAGANLAVSGQIPDLAKLAPFAGRPLPSLSQVALSGQIADAETGWRQWIRLSGFSLTMPQGDLSADASLGLSGPRPSLTASLTSKHLDLDALEATLAMPPPAPATAGNTSQRAAPPPPPLPPASTASATTTPPRLIPDTPIPFALLKTFDADITLGIGNLKAGGESYANLEGKLALKDGRLALSPFALQAPGGHVALSASVNAASTAPTVAVSLNAPALALRPLLAAFHLPADASGTLQVQAHLSGTGSTPHAIAAGLNGQVGVAMAGGTIDNQVIGTLLGSVLRVANVPPELLGRGQTEVRCLAARADITQGTATLAPLLLEVSRLTVSGGGSLALGPETLALRLDPSLLYGSGAISLPVRVGGTFLHPKLAPDIGAVAGQGAKPDNALSQLLGALRGAPAAAAVPACEPALALARFGQPGPAPPPLTPPPSGGVKGPSSQPSNSPLNLLRGLFHP